MVSSNTVGGRKSVQLLAVTIKHPCADGGASGTSPTWSRVAQKFHHSEADVRDHRRRRKPLRVSTDRETLCVGNEAFRVGFHKNPLFISWLRAPSAPPIRHEFFFPRNVLGSVNGNPMDRGSLIRLAAALSCPLSGVKRTSLMR